MSARGVIIADDHPVVLHGLHSLLQTAPEFDVVQVCADAGAALSAIAAHRPALALLDLRMPGRSVDEMIRETRARFPETRVIVLTAFHDRQATDAVLSAGAHDVLMKDIAPDQLVQRMRDVLAAPARDEPVADAGLTRASQSQPRALTEREQKVADLAATGLSNKAIARRLALTEATVKIHLHGVYRKLGVANRTELAARTRW